MKVHYNNSINYCFVWLFGDSKYFKRFVGWFLGGMSMQDILTLYQYIKSKYDRCSKIKHTGKEIVVKFHDEFEMKICLQDYFNIYFNDIFYYNVDGQDIKDTIDDFLTNQYAFCEQNKKLKIMKLKDFDVNTKYNHVWTIERTLK